MSKGTIRVTDTSPMNPAEQERSRRSFWADARKGLRQRAERGEVRPNKAKQSGLTGSQRERLAEIIQAMKPDATDDEIRMMTEQEEQSFYRRREMGVDALKAFDEDDLKRIGYESKEEAMRDFRSMDPEAKKRLSERFGSLAQAEESRLMGPEAKAYRAEVMGEGPRVQPVRAKPEAAKPGKMLGLGKAAGIVAAVAGIDFLLHAVTKPSDKGALEDYGERGFLPTVGRKGSEFLFGKADPSVQAAKDAQVREETKLASLFGGPEQSKMTLAMGARLGESEGATDATRMTTQAMAIAGNQGYNRLSDSEVPILAAQAGRGMTEEDDDAALQQTMALRRAMMGG